MLIWYLWHLQIFLFGWLGCAVISIPGLVNTHAWLNNLLPTAKSIINPVGCSAWHQTTSKIILDLKHLNFWWAKSKTLNNTCHNIWWMYHQISACFFSHIATNSMRASQSVHQKAYQFRQPTQPKETWALSTVCYNSQVKPKQITAHRWISWRWSQEQIGSQSMRHRD